MPGKRRNVASAVAQRRQGDRCRRQQGQQVGQEIALCGQILERCIAGRDQPRVDPERMARTDRADVAALERFQQALLHAKRKPVDLVQSQGPAVAMLKRPDLAIERAGERAFFMTEQGGFDHVFRDRPDVQDAKRRFGPGRGGVHRADDHFLAGAAFSLDQDRAVAASRLGRDGQRRAERRGRADHRVEVGRCLHLFGQRLQFVVRGFAHRRRAQRLHEAVGRDRLDQVVRHPGTHCFDRQERRSAAGKHQDRQARTAAAQFRDQRTGFLAGHPLVHDDRAQSRRLP